MLKNPLSFRELTWLSEQHLAQILQNQLFFFSLLATKSEIWEWEPLAKSALAGSCIFPWLALISS